MLPYTAFPLPLSLSTSPTCGSSMCGHAIPGQTVWTLDRTKEDILLVLYCLYAALLTF